VHNNTSLSSNSGWGNDGSTTVVSGPAEHLIICSLVLDAVGIPNRIDSLRAELIVPDSLANEAKNQLESYFEENANWPEPPPSISGRSPEMPQPTVLLIGCLAVFFLVTGPWSDHNAWFANGAIHSRAILEKNEWWRLVTALTLHADFLHLAGNCLIGGFLVHLLATQLGSGLSWMLLIICGTAGNYLNIAARETAHYSVGFSTSIFGAIGLFSGMQMVSGRKFRLRTILIPLGSGAGLLAMLGVEGERTDLGAHFFGFLCGVVLGMAVGLFSLQSLANRSILQRILLLLTLGAVIFCWLLAMRKSL